jgi:hypothetical protein
MIGIRKTRWGTDGQRAACNYGNQAAAAAAGTADGF